MWLSPTACARAISTATLPPSASSGFQTHMPLPSGMTGGDGNGGGGGRVVVVVLDEDVVGRRWSLGLATGTLRSTTGFTTPAGIGCGAAMRTSGGTAGGGEAGAHPPGDATAAVARMASASNAAYPAINTRAGICPTRTPPPMG